MLIGLSQLVVAFNCFVYRKQWFAMGGGRKAEFKKKMFAIREEKGGIKKKNQTGFNQ